MKYLLVIAVVGVVLWLMFGRQRGRGQGKPSVPPKADTRQLPVQIVACAHCGLNLPQTDALQDAAERPFCSEAHRAAGPR
ncbi:PP0621 family protein [Rubrivivax sp. RP6-9]|uniref:PP0621 family protein n=1 Tax=Rubrivivax sp. RP6-9 TaxID=3415750 RepID=UPI003CC57257